MQFNLLIVVAFLAIGSINADDCSSSKNFTISGVKIGDQIMTLSGSSTISVVQNDPTLYIPKSIYDQILKKLGAKTEGSFIGVPCDGTLKSLEAYPDIFFTINEKQLAVPAKAYIDRQSEYKKLCTFNLYTASRWRFTYGIPKAFQDTVCQLLK